MGAGMETMLDWKQAPEGFWALLVRGEPRMCEEVGNGVWQDRSQAGQELEAAITLPTPEPLTPGCFSQVVGERRARPSLMHLWTPGSTCNNPGCLVGQTELGSEPSTGKGIPKRRTTGH